VEPLADVLTDIDGAPLPLPEPATPSQDFRDGMLFGVALALAGDDADLPPEAGESMLAAMLARSPHPALAPVVRATVADGRRRLGWT
jgi:hypothetical protein